MNYDRDSHSSFNRFKTQHGLSRATPNVEKTPDYILQCRYKRDILENKDEIMGRLKELAPAKYAAMVQNGFETRIENFSDGVWERFLRLAADLGPVEAYLIILTPPKK